MRALFRIRDARVFLIGSGLSMLGDSAMFLVLASGPRTSRTATRLPGLVFFVLVLPSLFAPFAGLVIDRVRKKPLLIGVNCVMAAAVLLLLFVHDRGDLWLIYVVAGIYGAAGAVLGSARSAFLTVMLPRELLGDANAIFQSVREGLRLIAPLLGAGLYAAFSGRVVAIADGLTFVGLAVALLFVRTPGDAFRTRRAQLHPRSPGRRSACLRHAAFEADHPRDRGVPAGRRVFRDALLRRRRVRAAPAAVVPRCAQHVPGHRCHRRRADGARASAASATCAWSAWAWRSSRSEMRASRPRASRSCAPGSSSPASPSRGSSSASRPRSSYGRRSVYRGAWPPRLMSSSAHHRLFRSPSARR